MDGEYEQNLDGKTNLVKYIFSNSVLVLFVLFMGAESGFYSMYNYLLPLDLSANFGDNGAVIFGTLSSLNCIVVVLFTAAITSLLKKYFDTTKAIMGMSLFIVGYVIFFSLIRIVAFSYIGMIIFTWGEIIVTVNISPFLTRRIPASHRGRLMAFTNIFGSVFGSLIQLGIGRVYDVGGRTPAWLLAIGIGLISLTLLILIRHFDKIKYKNLYHSIISTDGCVISVRSANLATVKEYARNYKNNPTLDGDLFYNELNYNSDFADEYFNKISSDENRIYFFLMSDATPIGQIIIDKTIEGKCTCTYYLSNTKFLNKGYEEAASTITREYAVKKFHLEIENETQIKL